jgi:ribosomal protein L18
MKPRKKPRMVTRVTRIAALTLVPLLLCSAADAQEQGIRERLINAGASQAFANQVGAIVDGARDEGLPIEPLEAKAIEGWAKRNRVPPDRVVAVLERQRVQLREANQIVTRAQVAQQSRGQVVAAAAEALGRGMTPEQCRELIQSAPTPEAAVVGLTVAASLAAQGLDHGAAVHAVREMHRAGGPPDRAFELPSAVADMLARGTPMSDVARQILEGGGLPIPGGMGQGQGQGQGQGRPGMVPPARGPVTNPPGQSNRRRRN